MYAVAATIAASGSEEINWWLNRKTNSYHWARKILKQIGEIILIAGKVTSKEGKEEIGGATPSISVSSQWYRKKRRGGGGTTNMSYKDAYSAAIDLISEHRRTTKVTTKGATRGIEPPGRRSSRTVNCSLKGVQQEVRSAIELAGKQPYYASLNKCRPCDMLSMPYLRITIMQWATHELKTAYNYCYLFFISFINVDLLQVIVEFLAGLQWSSDSVSLRVEGEGEGLVRSLRHSMTLLLHPQWEGVVREGSVEVRERGTKVLVGMPEGGIHAIIHNLIPMQACLSLTQELRHNYYHV